MTWHCLQLLAYNDGIVVVNAIGESALKIVRQLYNFLTNNYVKIGFAVKYLSAQFSAILTHRGFLKGGNYRVLKYEM